MINKDAKLTAIFGIGVTVLASIICFIISVWAGVTCLAVGVILTGVYFYNIKKRNDKINELNNYLSLMCSGNFDLDIMDNSEGEMSILKNNLYKIMTLLKTQNEQLNTDKLYLANSLADISHQLKTPLTSMMVMSDLLKDEKDEGKRNEFLSIIETQLDKMKWLITNLLKISKLDAGATEFKHEKFNIAPILEKSLKQFYVTCDVREIEIVNEINDFEFVGDENWTGEAIENIIKNCIEHTNNNGKIRFFSEKTNVYNSLFIQDNGCGIAKEDLPHIFERFYHGKNSSSESVGIGLALAKTVLEKENLNNLLNEKDYGGTFVSDIVDTLQTMNTVIFIVQVFVYGFISLISLITIANIINTISTNISLRRKEFAMLKSVGTAPSGFRKMVSLESVFYALKAVIFGVPISVLVCVLLNKMLGESSIPYQFDYKLYLGVILVVFAIIAVTMIYSVRKLKDDNIIETLKEDIS